ncbi:hypothetical protein TNCT_380611 [Trichonephila clavata]|uniref:Uncharacterized protein n=1 Tax=Trichonephila clavata TaxID=2740835 RepID=A0A8X6K7T6_TRICU|nr:hypothetical protein TNCT_380611 [Trichonephila clavata]
MMLCPEFHPHCSDLPGLNMQRLTLIVNDPRKNQITIEVLVDLLFVYYNKMKNYPVSTYFQNHLPPLLSIHTTALVNWYWNKSVSRHIRTRKQPVYLSSERKMAFL